MAKTPPSPLIRLEGVTKRFGALVAVDNVSLEIGAGQFFALLGASGCGKTTLMRLIAGFEAPDAGKIWIDGQDMTGIPANLRPVNMMFQSYALFPHLNVFDNIAYGLRRAGVSRAEIALRVEEMLQLVQLQGFEKRWPHKLSGGQQQRVALARALARRPKLLLLDEPMAALDRKLREETQIELIALQARLGAAFLLVTHDQGEALAMAQTIAVMRAGRIIGQGTAGEIYLKPPSRYVAGFVGDINLFEGVVSSADALGLRLKMPNGKEYFARTAAAAGIRTGDKIALGVRPEFLRMSAEPPATAVNHLSGEIAGAVFLGQTMLYRIRLADGTVLKISAALGGVARRRYECGTAVAVWFAPEDAMVLRE